MNAFTLSRGPSKEDKKYFTSGDPDTLFSDLQEIGHGAFGAVYCALDERPKSATRGQNVAIKKMSYSGKSEKFTDIVHEIKLLERLKHKNIVRLEECFLKDKDHMVWIVMEYCLGSASDLVDVQPGRLLESEVAQIIRDVLHGLSYLHSNEIIHRDIKAGNILLSENGLAKVADFGSASNKSSANSFVGSPYWMAPEVILAMESGRYTGAVDLWSLGITCIEIADRKPPMFTQNAMAALYQIAQSDAPTLDQNADWSHTFHSFLSCLLKKNPEERFTATEALQHSWFKDNRENPQELVELIDRTKRLVREQDEKQITMQYKKMLRIYKGGDPLSNIPRDGSMRSNSSNPISEDRSSDEEEEDDDQMSYLQSSTSSAASDKSAFPLNHSLSRPPTIRPIRNTQPQQQQHGGGVDHFSGMPPIYSVSSGSRASGPQDFSQGPLGNGLSTIRPVTLMRKQEEERIKVSAFREQMGNYKKMRQSHRAMMQNLESTLSSEMENHQRTLQNELNNMRKKHQKDRQKLANRRLQSIERLEKEGEQELRAFDRLLFQKKKARKSRWRKSSATKCDEQINAGERESFQLASREINKNSALVELKQSI
ncbi:Oidioi.mRNA.OKI2018_I69.chr2.g6788.t1.cds [Oikopleura dioica]|uniref:non-specific serine/threonine protein kinase n=1 Tax=Oikopleura dioica TaxID=34765 RepID=A0ABN7T7N4_OIKDI|nr:Oidioi.mRNA.OKI2018_I69.chr2.g6788.t1.cds [Oikopleura dioica]